MCNFSPWFRGYAIEFDTVGKVRSLIGNLRTRLPGTITHELTHYVDHLTYKQCFNAPPVGASWYHSHLNKHGVEPMHPLRNPEFYPTLMGELECLHTDVELFGKIPVTAMELHLELYVRPGGMRLDRSWREMFEDRTPADRLLHTCWHPHSFFSTNRDTRPSVHEYACQVVAETAQEENWLRPSPEAREALLERGFTPRGGSPKKNPSSRQKRCI